MELDIQRDGQISKYRGDLEKVARLAFKAVSALLPVEGVKIFMRHDPSSAIPELGVSGYSPDGDEVYLAVDASHPKFKSFVIPNVYRTLLHELHHTARWRGPGYGETLLDSLVTEGLADHFELELTHNTPQPWDTALSVKEKQSLLGRAKKELHSKQYSHEDWFYGSKKRNIPRWTGYTLGFDIVGEYLKKNPDEKPSTLYLCDAHVIYDGYES
ncbi:MAG: DUF2268 domain-containing putative Zn-dependent protease [bacterium]|nr:DUF2268 domain-containing putative Zn-dependent protease [bacterium]